MASILILDMHYSFQVAANQQQDRLIFAVAKELESAFGGWVPPPSKVRPSKIPQTPLEKVIVQEI